MSDIGAYRCPGMGGSKRGSPRPGSNAPATMQDRVRRVGRTQRQGALFGWHLGALGVRPHELAEDSGGPCRCWQWEGFVVPMLRGRSTVAHALGPVCGVDGDMPGLNDAALGPRIRARHCAGMRGQGDLGEQQRATRSSVIGRDLDLKACTGLGSALAAIGSRHRDQALAVGRRTPQFRVRLTGTTTTRTGRFRPAGWRRTGTVEAIDDGSANAAARSSVRRCGSQLDASVVGRVRHNNRLASPCTVGSSPTQQSPRPPPAPRRGKRRMHSCPYCGWLRARRTATLAAKCRDLAA